MRLKLPLTSIALALALAAGAVHAQTAPARFEGTTVLLTGAAELEIPNDEAVASLYLEVQDADLQRAQSLINQRVAEGVAQLRHMDPKAQIETAGYSSYPVYQAGTPRKQVGWRVRQNVTYHTTELATLPRAVAAGQQHLALGGIEFRLSRAARERIEAELIERAIANLTARLATAARTLNVPPERVRLEELNFGVAPPPMPVALRMRAEAMAGAASVEEPQLDAGRSLQQLTVTGKARLLLP